MFLCKAYDLACVKSAAVQLPKHVQVPVDLAHLQYAVRVIVAEILCKTDSVGHDLREIRNLKMRQDQTLARAAPFAQRVDSVPLGIMEPAAFHSVSITLVNKSVVTENGTVDEYVGRRRSIEESPLQPVSCRGGIEGEGDLVVQLGIQRPKIAAESVVKYVEILRLKLRRLLAPDPRELAALKSHGFHTLTL